MSNVNVAIVGATGMVGRTFLKVLEDHEVPVGNLVLLASEKSVGSHLTFNGKDYPVELLTEAAFDPERFQYALFSAGGSVSKEFAPIAAAKGITVIDNSSAWRMNPAVPLVVPEVNFSALDDSKIIANPNCSTIQSVYPLAVIDRLFSAKRVIYNSYQAVSGSGLKGVRDLERTLAGEAPEFYPKPIANNCLPQIDDFLPGGYTKEEQKMIDETRKILGKPELAVTATCVRVPVLNGHSVSINVTCERPIDLPALLDAFDESEGIVLYRDGYPTALDVTGRDEIMVGRVRLDDSEQNTLNLWCVADNVRKGAATNAVQILERMINNDRII